MTLTKSIYVNPNNTLLMTMHLCRSLLLLFIAITCGELTAQADDDDSLNLSTIPLLDNGEKIVRSKRDLNRTPEILAELHGACVWQSPPNVRTGGSSVTSKPNPWCTHPSHAPFAPSAHPRTRHHHRRNRPALTHSRNWAT